MKKILFIHHATGWGGAPLNMMNIINSLDKSKYEPFVLLIKDSIVSQKLKQAGIPYKIAEGKFYKFYYKYYSHTVAGYTKWFNFLKQFRLITSWILSRYIFAPRVLKNFNFDIVQLNSSVLIDWLAPCRARGKVVIHIQEPFSQGSFGFRSRFFRSQMIKYADRIITISRDNSKRIGIPDKTEIIYNYSSIPEQLPPESSYESKKALYLGGTGYIKGFYTIVEALDYLDMNVKVYFGGSYNSKQNLPNVIVQILKSLIPFTKKKETAINKIKNNPNAILLGMIDTVDDILNQICCLISPHTVSHFSRPVIEAHLHKKPAIGSDVEGMEEIIEHNKTGIIFTKDNPKELAKAINFLSASPEIAKEMGEEGYKVAKEKYTPINIRQFEKIYDSL